MTSTSQDLPSQPSSRSQKLPQREPSLQVPRVVSPSRPTHTISRFPELGSDENDESARNKPAPLFSDQAFAAFPECAVGQTRTDKADDARHPCAGAQLGNLDFGRDFPGFVFPGPKNIHPTSQQSRESQESLFRFKGNHQEQIYCPETKPVVDKSNIPPGPQPQMSTPGTISSQMEDLSMENVDPIQVAKLFSDCGRAFPFYGIPAKEIPESPFFSHDFQLALLSGIRIARSSAAILDHLIVLQNCRERPRSSGKQSGEWIPRTKTIAFLGNSAAGKSSVINSLLDFPDIASIGNIGSAITTVVTEYRQKDLGEAQRIKIEVEYLSQSASEEHIKELLWSYRRESLPDISESPLSVTDSKPDNAKFAKESKQAWVALEAVFGSEEGFNLDFLSDQSDGALERITDKLIQWSANIPWPSGSTDGK